MDEIYDEYNFLCPRFTFYVVLFFVLNILPQHQWFLAYRRVYIVLFFLITIFFLMYYLIRL